MMEKKLYEVQNNTNNYVLLSIYFYLISILLLWKIEMISNYKCTFGLKEGENTSVLQKQNAKTM
jgi:hypothetical protein